MKMQLNVSEIKESVKDYVIKQGINPDTKDIEVEISGGRKDYLVADITITDKTSQILKEACDSYIEEEVYAPTEPIQPKSLRELDQEIADSEEDALLDAAAEVVAPWMKKPKVVEVTEDTPLFSI